MGAEASPSGDGPESDIWHHLDLELTRHESTERCVCVLFPFFGGPELSCEGANRVRAGISHDFENPSATLRDGRDVGHAGDPGAP